MAVVGPRVAPPTLASLALRQELLLEAGADVVDATGDLLALAVDDAGTARYLAVLA